LISGSRRLRRIVLLILLLPAMAGCAKASPTAPGFSFNGNWTGFFKDYTSSQVTGSPFGGPLTMSVGKNGTASAAGERSESTSFGTLTCKINMEFIVMPDGSLQGTGTWNNSLSGWYGYHGSGEVYGQLNSDTDKGSGDLQIELNGVLWHFPWRVEKVK